MTRRHWLAMMAIALTLPSVGWASSPEEQGKEIALKEKKALQGYVSETSEVELVLIDVNGSTTSRRMSTARIEMDNDGDRSRVEITWPADVKGTRLLTWSHEKKTDDQWLYLPAMSAVKRIAGGNKSGSFMGSEFSFEDFSTFEVEKYTYKFLEEATLDGRKVWKYERYPTDPKSGYKMQVSYTDQEYLAPLRIDYYDKKGELLKEVRFSNYQQQDGHWRPAEVHAVNVQTRKESRMVTHKRALGVDLPRNYFLSNALGD